MSCQTASRQRPRGRAFKVLLGIAIAALAAPTVWADELIRYQRNLLPLLLDQMAYSIPDGVALKSIRQSGAQVRVAGYAASSSRASAFVRGLERSELPLSAELAGVKEARIAGGRISEFAVDLAPKSEPVASLTGLVDAGCDSLPPPLEDARDIEGALVAIQMAGLGNSVEFDLFKPGAESAGGPYTGLPTAIRVHGGFDDIRRFVHDLNRLPTLVVLSDFAIQEIREDSLRMDAIVTVYRASGRGKMTPVRAQSDRRRCSGGAVKARFMSDPFSRAGL